MGEPWFAPKSADEGSGYKLIHPAGGFAVAGIALIGALMGALPVAAFGSGPLAVACALVIFGVVFGGGLVGIVRWKSSRWTG